MTLLLALILSLEAQAKTLYVDVATGNDATTYADNDINNKWASIGRAAWGHANRSTPSSTEAAQAGDTVLVTPGTYSGVGTNSRFDSLYNSYNSGSAGNPITYECTTDRACVLTLSSGTGAMIGACGTGGGCTFGAVDYITWKGFYIDEATAPSNSDTGPIVFAYMTGGTLLNSECNGGGDAGGRNDNHNCVRVEKSRDIVIRNNKLHNVYNGPGNSDLNAAAILNYNTNGLLIENNELYDAGTCIFEKVMGFSGADPDSEYYQDTNNIIRKNLCHDVTFGLAVDRQIMETASVYTIWSQNIVHTGVGLSDGGIVIHAFSVDGAEPMDGSNQNRFVNNSIHGFQMGFRLLGQSVGLRDLADNLVQNNIFSNSADYHIETILTSALATTFETDRLFFERNWYYTAGIGFQRDSSTRTFAQWQSAYPGQDPNSTSGTDPQFVNAAAGDFHLQVGSPARTAGRVVHSIGGTNGDTIPVGAYITGDEIIGIENVTPSLRFVPSFLRAAVQP